MLEDFSLEDIRGLAEMERKMDSGEQPFVIYGNGRAAMSKDTMEKFNLKQGQTISDIIFIAIQKSRIEECQKKIDKEHLEIIKPSDF
jgi:hypothetical protein